MADDFRIIPEEPERGGRDYFGTSKKAFVGFVDFIRERGVMGLAIGFVLGTSVQRVVTAFVTDIVNPFVGTFMGNGEGLKNFAVGRFLVGDFISVTIDFLILILIVYAVFKMLGLEKLDKKKE